MEAYSDGIIVSMTDLEEHAKDQKSIKFVHSSSKVRVFPIPMDQVNLHRESNSILRMLRAQIVP